MHRNLKLVLILDTFFLSGGKDSCEPFSTIEMAGKHCFTVDSYIE